MGHKGLLPKQTRKFYWIGLTQTILLFGAHGQNTAVTKTKKVLQDWFDTGNFTCSSQGPLGQDTAVTCFENGMRTDNRISFGKTAVFL